jgi:aquaporin Z
LVIAIKGLKKIEQCFSKGDSMQKYLMEFIGTFFLVLVIGLCVIEPGAGVMAPLAIGTILMVMVYAGGHLSGAHYNPAVTLAVWLRGKCDTKDVPFYWGAQLLGSLAASLVVMNFKNTELVSAANPDLFQVFVVEALFTFALAFVVLNVATSSKTAGNSYYGLAIGFTVMASAYAIGGISGCAINPVVAVGVTFMGLSQLSNLWIFIVANFAGGAIAAGIFKFLNKE